jgi:hypothetical protein
LCEFAYVRFAATNSLSAISGLGYQEKFVLRISLQESRPLPRSPWGRYATVTLHQDQSLLCNQKPAFKTSNSRWRFYTILGGRFENITGGAFRALWAAGLGHKTQQVQAEGRK